MASERYECRNDRSSKFWEPEVKGKTLVVRYGRIGSKGQTSEKVFATKAEATRERDRLVREKIKKGYVLAQNEVLAYFCVGDFSDIRWDGLVEITSELNKALEKKYEILGECDAVSAVVENNTGDRGQIEPSAMFENLDEIYQNALDLGADKLVAFGGNEKYFLVAVRGAVTKLQVAMEALKRGKEYFDDEMLNNYCLYYNL